jgi:hypothetical protein
MQVQKLLKLKSTVAPRGTGRPPPGVTNMAAKADGANKLKVRTLESTHPS